MLLSKELSTEKMFHVKHFLPYNIPSNIVGHSKYKNHVFNSKIEYYHHFCCKVHVKSNGRTNLYSIIDYSSANQMSTK